MELNLLNNDNLTLLHILDWNEVLAALRHKIYFDEAGEYTTKWPYFRKKEELKLNFISIDYYLKIKDNLDKIIQEEFSFIPPDQNLAKIIKKLSISQILDFNELNILANMFTAQNLLIKEFKHFDHFTKYNLDHAINQKIYSKFLKPIRIFLDRSGEIDFYKHPELSVIYKQIITAEYELRNLMNGITKQGLFKDALQYTEHDIIGDHYVLAIRSDSYKSSMGHIIARSGSGMTLLVEPKAVRERGQQRMHHLAQLDEIKNKICLDYSQHLQTFYREFILIKNFIFKIDILKARSGFSYDHDLIRPEISDSFKIEIQKFWHPLINNPVKNSIELGKSHKGLIISGPNTGGKTVTLKSIAICYMFLYSGLFIPAHQASLYPIKELYYFGNDGQDITHGLSSFAAEARNYLNLLNNIKEDSLILIDEIFNSTSSEEASSLAISLLDKLQNKVDAKVIISTHHQFLKTYMHDNDEYQSAHVEYDHDKNLPTYKLFYGEPGSSLAFKVFENMQEELGINEDITSKARDVYDKKQYLYEKLLEELAHKKSKFYKLVQENSELNRELKNQKQSMQGILLMEKQKAFSSYQTKMDKLIKQAKDLIRGVKDGNNTSKKKVFIETQQLSSELLREKENLYKKNNEENIFIDTTLNIREITKGEFYYCISLNKQVEVQSINTRKNEVQVKTGKMIFRTSVEELRNLKNKVSKKPRTVQINLIVNPSEKMEIDCRGMRLDEFESVVESHLQEVLAGNIPFINIIHGHGDGILKKWLRNRIQEDDSFEWSNMESNDGHSEIKLKF